jgi:hypothetical protein
MSCSSGDMGNGTAMKGAGVPAGGWITHQLVALDALTSTTTVPPTTATKPGKSIGRKN